MLCLEIRRLTGILVSARRRTLLASVQEFEIVCSLKLCVVTLPASAGFI